MTDILETSKVRYLNELSDFHVKDIERLTPGAPVLVLHTPPLFRGEMGYSAHPYFEKATVEKAFLASCNDEQTSRIDEAWADERIQRIALKFGEKVRSVYASDFGVIPYAHGQYNDTNALVLLEDLDAAGLFLMEEMSPLYLREVEEYNAGLPREDWLDYE